MLLRGARLNYVLCVADAGASRKGRLEKAKEHLDKGLITEEEFKKIENTVLNETQLSTLV